MSTCPKGKGGKSFQDREISARVRALALNEIEKVLLKGEGDLYKAVLIKLAGTVLPRLNEHTGGDGDKLFPTPIYGGQSIQVQRHNSDEEDI